MAPRWVSMALFVALFLFVWVGANLYLAAKVTRPFGLAGAWAWAARGVAVLLAVAYPMGRLIDNAGAPKWLVHVCAAGGATWLGVAAIAFSVFILADLVHACWRLGIWLAQRSSGGEPGGLLRYLFVPLSRPVTVALLGLCAAAAVAALLLGHADPVVRYEEIRVPAQRKIGGSVRIVQLSDLHLDYMVGPDVMARVIEQVQALSPDLVVITGDLLDETSAEVTEAVGRLSTLQPRLGILAVTGNHELYSGSGHFFEQMERLGIPVLRQESRRVLPHLVVAGIDDPHVLSGMEGKRPDVEGAVARALAGAGDDDYVVLLAHRPADAARYGTRADLILAGHTHGGQIAPFQLVSALTNGGYLYGLYAHGGGWVNVSAGAATWGPRMRLLSRSEIVVLDLIE